MTQRLELHAHLSWPAWLVTQARAAGRPRRSAGSAHDDRAGRLLVTGDRRGGSRLGARLRQPAEAWRSRSALGAPAAAALRLGRLARPPPDRDRRRRRPRGLALRRGDRAGSEPRVSRAAAAERCPRPGAAARLASPRGARSPGRPGACAAAAASRSSRSGPRVAARSRGRLRAEPSPDARRALDPLPAARPRASTRRGTSRRPRGRRRPGGRGAAPAPLPPPPRRQPRARRRPAHRRRLPPHPAQGPHRARATRPLSVMQQRATAFIEALAGKHRGERASVIFNPAEYSLREGQPVRQHARCPACPTPSCRSSTATPTR